MPIPASKRKYIKKKGDHVIDQQVANGRHPEEDIMPEKVFTRHDQADDRQGCA
ncbi:MAG: hypothetical protein ACXWNC_04045 [Anaerolineales bacterium]